MGNRRGTASGKPKILVLAFCSALALHRCAFRFCGTDQTGAIGVIGKARIQEGVKSGELTRHEAHKLRAEQRTIRAEKRMAKADGVVTAEERAKIKHDQKRASRHIYKQKHDEQKKPS